jgi:hypothetical protein
MAKREPAIWKRRAPFTKITGRKRGEESKTCPPLSDLAGKEPKAQKKEKKDIPSEKKCLEKEKNQENLINFWKPERHPK